MSKKYFNLSGKAVGKDGMERMVTIVGEFEKAKLKKGVFAPKIVEGEDTMSFITRKETTKKLTYALAICHPDDMDNFNEDVAIEIAKRRINKNPMGWLETTSPTNLSKDQIILILFGELKYAIDHVDDFIVKVC